MAAAQVARRRPGVALRAGRPGVRPVEVHPLPRRAWAAGGRAGRHARGGVRAQVGAPGGPLVPAGPGQVLPPPGLSLAPAFLAAPPDRPIALQSSLERTVRLVA